MIFALFPCLNRAACILYCSISFAAAFAPRRTILATASTTLHASTMTAAPTLNLEEKSASYKSLLDKLRTITHLEHASSVLNYDRQV